MKLRLKVSKELKKSLKQKAEKNNLERKDYVVVELQNYLKENEIIWKEKVTTFPDVLKERKLKLVQLKESFEEGLDDKEMQAILKQFYTEHKMFKYIHSKKRKLENIIIHVSEEEYYGLHILAEEKDMHLLNFVEQCLHHL